ncbi:MAG: 6-phosphogluconolactonase [Gammaproteobacteria bacterium]|nr:6-phosphogluconolactonase [Gammaproteobacteria bacterium]
MVTLTNNIEIKIFPTANDLFQFGANDFKNRAIAAVNAKGNFSVVLAGGNTPKLFFDILTSVEDYKKNIPWQQIQFFFGDERYVSSADEKSNYHTAYEHLFSKVPVNSKNIFRMPTELDNSEDVAKSYEQTLRQTFKIKDDAFPDFDLVYLGLGDNAHTASLMPSSDLVKHFVNHSLTNNNQLVASLYVSELNMNRITLTPPAINNAKAIIFLVTGANKANAVHEVLEEKLDPIHYPAQLIHCIQGKTIWYLDRLASTTLSFPTV